MVLKPLVRLCAFVVKVACLWFEEKDILENTTGLLRHSCHLSQDKNRTKHNLESGKCRVSFHFYPSPGPLFLQMHLHRSANRGLVQIWEFFRTSKSEICWQELVSALTRATPDHQAPFPDFFRNRNNKQTVKRFLIAIRNSKTVYHRPISHSRMQFMAYLVVFISFAILLGCLWITRQLQILHLHKSNSFRKRANLKA